MTTLNVSLPDNIKEFVEAEVTEGGYDTASEYICQLLEAERQRQAQVRLEALLMEGLNSGESKAATPEWWEQLHAEAVSSN